MLPALADFTIARNHLSGMRSMRIAGTGAALPEKIVLSSELERRLGLPAGWIERKTGIRQRRHSGGPKESAARLGAAAARQALAEAGQCLADVDYLIAAAGTMQQPIPCNAAMILSELGGKSNLGAFDINATCLGFVQAFDVAASMLAAGQARRILIVCSEIASSGIDWEDRDSCVLLGDGAAAVLLEAETSGEGQRLSILSSGMRTFPGGTEACCVEGGGTSLPGHAYRPENKARYLFRMDGGRLHKIVSKGLPPFVDRLLERAGIGVKDLDLVVPHQAGELPLRLVSKRLGLPWDRMIVILGEVGNTIAASIPMALHHARTTGRWQSGSHVMLIGTSAGVSVGGAILRIES